MQCCKDQGAPSNWGTCKEEYIVHKQVKSNDKNPAHLDPSRWWKCEPGFFLAGWVSGLARHRRIHTHTVADVIALFAVCQYKDESCWNLDCLTRLKCCPLLAAPAV